MWINIGSFLGRLQLGRRGRPQTPGPATRRGGVYSVMAGAYTGGPVKRCGEALNVTLGGTGMLRQLDRRRFLQWSAATGVMTWAAMSSAQDTPSANDTLSVGVMGINGRGLTLAEGFASRPGVEVLYVCDVDARAVAKTKAALAAAQKREPQGVGDFRRILDDPAVDVLVIAVPNHWHARATISGCAAGKHVYVEKPCSHTAEEGELAVAAGQTPYAW